MYVSFDLSNPNVALDRMNLCIYDLRIWMIRNKLKINDSKTEFLIITSSFLELSYDDSNIMVGDSNIVSSNSACNLVVIFDKCIKLDYHISSVQYNPRLQYEANYTECTAWYTVDHVLTIRRPGLCR